MKLFYTRIDNYSKEELKSYIINVFKKTTKVKIAKINTEFLQRSLNEKKFLDVLNSSNLNIVDGRGVMWAARYLTLPISDNKYIRPIQSVVQMVYSGASIVLKPSFIKYPIANAVPGVEAFNLMMQTASDSGVGVFLFGGDKGALNLSVKNIKENFPKLKISGSLNGYDYQTNKKIDPVAEINNTDAKLLIVALGSPKQEYWINDNIDKLKNIKVAVGEGGTLDRIAHPFQKSPKFINKIGLEWLWRSMFNKSKTENRNSYQKFWNAVPGFIFQAVKFKIKNGQTKVADDN